MQSTKIKVIVNLLRLTLLAAILASIYFGSWYNFSIASLCIILTFIPAWFQKKYDIEIPVDFEFATIFFVYASLFLGEINNFYYRFWWWDVMLHFISAIGFACVGFIILYILFQTNRISSKPIWLAIFSFCFSVSIGALWEIFEFSVDQLLGLNMQKSGLMDTMWDLITNSVGAFIASLAGYFYLKGRHNFFFYRLFDRFIKDNRNLLKVYKK